MKKNLFYIYIMIIASGALYLGVHKYRQYQANKTITTNSSQVIIPSGADKSIDKYEAQLAKSPGDVQVSLQLAAAYIQKARETGDTQYYNKVDRLMDQAESASPDNPDIYATRGNIALSRHHFKDALALGQQAVALNPNKALYYGIIVDAQTELGKNEEAIATLQTMVDKRPDYSSFTRIAYARELHGDINGARQALQTAIQEGAAFPENVAFGYVELGKLDMRTDLVKAEQQFNLALSVVPNYPPAEEQLGKIAFAKNDNNAAIAHFQAAFKSLPLAQYATDLGELYARIGDKTKASQQYELARIAFEKSQQSGVNTDMELSLFLSEHDLDNSRALQLAIESYKIRPSIYGADTLAWAYYKNNQTTEALQYSKEALRLGEFDPSIVFHAGMIAEQNGDSTAAKQYFRKVITLNPHFSLLHAGISEAKVR